MKKMILLIAMITLVAFISGAMAQPKPAAAPTPAPAPEKPKTEKMHKFSGSIEKVDEMAKMIDVKGKAGKEEKTMTFAVDDKTKVSKGKTEMKLADLKQGMMASVQYKKEGDKMIAEKITISTPKAPKEKKEPAPAKK